MTYLDFMPLTANRGGQLGNLAGAPYAQWATSKLLIDYWGDPNNWGNALSPEIYGIGECGGEQWLTLTRLGPHKLTTLKAIVTRGGIVKEITCDAGHPYALLAFVPHSIEVWGLVADLKFYWRASYELADMANPLLGTLPCIVQSEVWGNDDYTGKWQWTRGGPQPPTAIPFAGDKPAPIVTESAWFQGIAKGYGPGWVMGEIKDGARVVTSCANSRGWNW